MVASIKRTVQWFRLADRRWAGVGSCVVLLCTLACSSDGAVFAPTNDQHQLLVSVHLNERAFNLTTTAPYNTVQLHATALLADGTTAPGAVRFQSTAPDKFAVDSTGVITAISGTEDGGTYLILASLTYGATTRRDSAYVCVRDGAPLQIQRARILADGLKYDTIPSTSLDAVIFGTGPAQTFGGFLDANDSLVADPLCADIRVTDTTVIRQIRGSLWSPFSDLSLVVIDTGNTWMTLSTYAYGKEIRDSVFVRVSPVHIHRVVATYIPDVAVPGIQQTVVFSPSQLVVAPGSDVVFQNCCHAAIDVIFDDSSAAEASTDLIVGTNGTLTSQGNFLGGLNEHGGSGNIAPFKGFEPPAERYDEQLNGNEARRFTRPGRYPFHSSNGATGVIIVQ